MQILVANLFWCIIISLFISHIPNHIRLKRNVYYFFAFSSIFIIRTFVKPSSLPDLDTYLEIFTFSHSATWDEVLSGKTLAVSEYGFMILCKLCASVSDSYHLLFAVISIIWIYSYSVFFNRYSPYIGVPVLLLLVTEFPQSLFVLRQHLAMALLLFSYPYIINRNFKKFCIIGLLAFSMHMTSVIFFPMYFLYGMSNKRTLIITIFIMTIGSFFLFKYLDMINENMGLSYDNYINGTKSGFSNLTDFAMRITYLLSYLFIFKGKVLQSGINKLITILLVFSTILALFGTSFSLTGRLVRYFTPAIMIMVPIVMSHIKDRKIRWFYFIGVFTINTISIYFGSMSEWIKNYCLSF